MNETANATPIFAPLWRYKWLIVLVGLLVAAGTYFYYKRQPSLYSVTTQLYLGAGAEEAGLFSGANTKALLVSSGNQTILINSSIVEGVHRQLRKEHKPAAAHGTVHAKAAEKSQFIAITAEARTAKGAALLANTTARLYIAHERASYLREVEKALAIARRQLHRVQETQAITTTTTTTTTAAASAPAKGKGKSGAGATGATPHASGGSSTSLLLQTAALSSKVNQLESELSIKGVQQLAPARPAGAMLLSPKPRQNALFGLMIGLLLGAVAAYGLSRMNPRLRTLEDVERIFKTRILAALPAVRRPIVNREGQPGPSAPLLEPLRRLHTSLQLGGSIGGDELLQARSIVFVSADPYDGKSTLVANLAGVQCEAGEHVVIIDADLRRPAQARLHGMARQQGLVEVLEGRLSVHDAVQRVDPLGFSQASVAVPASEAGRVATVARVSSPSAGERELSVLANAGGTVNPPALLASPAMAELLRTLAEDFDRVLIDAPSPLEVSDAMPLLNIVDGIVIVTRIGHTRQTAARRLQELLARTASAPVLGTVVGSVRSADVERYGFSSPTSRRGGLKQLLR